MAVSAVVVEADVAADVEAAVVVAASANVTNAMVRLSVHVNMPTWDFFLR